MGIRFEVTGATVEEFTQNALQAFAVLAMGLQQVANAASPASVAVETDPPSPPPTEIPTMEPLENPKLTPGPATTSTATSTPSTAPTASVGPVETTQLDLSATTQPAPGRSIKPEEISQTLAKVMTEAEKRGWNPARRRNYARQLLASIGGAKKVTDLDTDEKRADFIGNSHAFVTGTASEDLDDEIPHL